MKNTGIKDTIAAISTALGPGGIGIVRLSGPESIAILQKLFRARGDKSISQFIARKVYYGHIVRRDGQILDEVLTTVMPAPKSYTCEDVVEISCHGGLVAVRAILELVLEQGVRLAEPGEFTKRAFLNGRLDLVQAEAVLDMINAKTESLFKASANQLKGDLTIELEKIRQDLLKAYIQLEALVNFPEDEIEEQGRIQIGQSIQQAQEKTKELLRNSEAGRLLREGLKVVLCGRPNVGKSSLLNVLLRQPRAIVSDVAGTTRDTIEEQAQISGIPLQLIDTAGILEPRDLIEVEAIKRSQLSIQSADLVLLVLAANEKLIEDDLQIIQSLAAKNVLVIVNKSDLENILTAEMIAKVLPERKILWVSALAPHAFSQLERAIEENIFHGQRIDTDHALLTNVRHIDSLKQALQFLEEATASLQGQLSLEFISEHLKNSLHALDQITGRDVDADLLDQIFSSFCIGK